MIEDEYNDKDDDMKTHGLKALALLVAVMFAATAGAQDYPWTQDRYCPGWNNPNNFNSGHTTTAGGYGIGYYSGQGGTVPSSHACPNVMTGETGITWNTLYSATQMDQGVNANGACSSTSYSNAAHPQRERQFRIMSETGYDPNTDNHLRYVPTQYNTYDTGDVVNTNFSKSIRVGDVCANGGTYGGSALYYHIRPTTQNAMLYLYYAIVAEAPTHGMKGNPTFIIRVMRQNGSSWQQISDTLAYYITCTPTSSNSVANQCANMSPLTASATYTSNLNGGWYQAQNGNVYFKDWAKVAINLNNYLYETLRVEVMIYDCQANYHYAYAYIAGECRPMALTASGCPAGRSTAVTTITAPKGMSNYEWRVSNFGVSTAFTDLNPGGDNSHFSFRTLASGNMADSMFKYDVQASDFHINYRTRTPGGHDSVMVDSIGKDQTFECKMTSALDPAKPFATSLYINVTNTKPTMMIDSLSLCDGTVQVRNQSYVPGMPNLVVDSATQWSFYNTAACVGNPVYTTIGDTAQFTYPDRSVKGVVVRSYTTDPTCWSEAQYPIVPKLNPKVGMTISQRVLCDADETTITDTTQGVYRRWWIFLNDSSSTDSNAVYDTISGWGVADENTSITRGFTHSIEPITLLVRNGLYYVAPSNVYDTIYCQGYAHDTVAVFVHPELEVVGDTIVCEGSLTDATVRAVGVENCTYEWSNTYGIITGNLPAGNHLAVAPYADTSVYYVRVTTQEGCVAWDSVHAYLVRPQLYMLPTDGRICPGDEAVLIAAAADHYTWRASPADPSLAGQDTAAEVHVHPMQTTTYTMIGHGTNNCDATPLTKKVTVIPLPVPRITTNPNFVDADEPTITLRDVSPGGVRSEWLFNNSELVTTREVKHTFEEATGRDSVYVKLTAYNVLDCPADETFGINVMNFTAWFPNAFTPGSEDENARFRLYTLTEYEFFHIYIYNRGGQLMFESTDPAFEWDGTYRDDPCPQGAYVYVCNYRKNGTPTLMTKNGTITLIR